MIYELNTKSILRYWSHIMIIIGLTLIISCNDDDACAETIQGPTILLSANSNAYVQNFASANKLIFIDENQNEVEFDVGGLNRTFTSYSGSAPCLADSSRTSPIAGEAEIVEFALSNNDLDQSILIRLWALPELLNPSGAQLILQYGNLSNAIIDSEYLMIHHTDIATNFTTTLDSVLLGNKIFYDAIEVNPSNSGITNPFEPSLEIKYNIAQGIIYIKDVFNNRTLVYDRKE